MNRLDYDRAWQELHDATNEEGRDYLIYHKERHWETFAVLAPYLVDIDNPRVLEVGISAIVRLYGKLFPKVRLTTLDRPTEMFGVSQETAINEWGAACHYNLNLNTCGLHPSFGNPPIGRHDFIVFCEVLEHLPISATQLVTELLGLLEPEGLLYITTPNFFAYDRIKRVMNRENPQEHFLARGSDKWASTHFREYSMSELFVAVSEAGGKVVQASYSECWMEQAIRSVVSDAVALRSNLAILVSHATSSREQHDNVASVEATFGPLTIYEWATLGKVV